MVEEPEGVAEVLKVKGRARTSILEVKALTNGENYPPKTRRKSMKVVRNQ